MLTLYFSPTCAFSQRVLQIADSLNVDLDLRDVSDEASFKEELVVKSGDTKTPFLVDTEREVAMPESNDIIEYLRNNYAQSGAPVASRIKPRVHVGGSVCESCEG